MKEKLTQQPENKYSEFMPEEPNERSQNQEVGSQRREGRHPEEIRGEMERLQQELNEAEKNGGEDQNERINQIREEIQPSDIPRVRGGSGEGDDLDEAMEEDEKVRRQRGEAREAPDPNNPLGELENQIDQLPDTDLQNFFRFLNEERELWGIFRQLNNILSETDQQRQQREEEFNRKIEQARLVATQNGVEEGKGQVKNIIRELRSDANEVTRLQRRGGEIERDPDLRRQRQPESIEELSELIESTNPNLWGTKGKFPLRTLDAEGKETINQANFLKWLRESMMYWHDLQSDDAINLGQLVGVYTPFTQINIDRMTRDKGKFFRTKEGQDLESLAMQCQLEVWLFGTSRNNHVQYQSVMFEDEKLVDAINQLYYPNTFTKTVGGMSTLERILTLPENFNPPHAERTTGKEERPEGNVGEAIRTAFLMYYHLSNIDELKKVAGEDSPLLNRSGFEQYIREAEIDALETEMTSAGYDVRDEEKIREDERERLRKEGRDVTEEEFEEIVRSSIENSGFLQRKREKEEELRQEIPEEVQKKWLGMEDNKSVTLDMLFNENGKPKSEENYGQFIEYINFFTNPQKETNQVNLVRELIKKTVKEKYHNPNVEVDDSDEMFGLPTYAENWAFSMTRWTGVAAKNDTPARSHDFWTQLQLTKFKRLRDTAKSRAKGAGNPYSIDMFKGLTPDFLNGVVIETDHKTTPYQLLMRMEEKSRSGEEYDIREELSKMKFSENTMRQFAGVHLRAALKIHKVLSDAQELDFDKFITYDRYGRMVFNQADFQSEIQGFYNNFRNAYSTWGEINFAAEVPVLIENRPPKYENKTIAEALFGKEILDVPEFQGKDKKFDASLINDNKDVLWKMLAKGFIATQIYAHRDLNSTFTHYEYETIEGIYDALATIPAGIKTDEKNLQNTKLTGRAFEKKDIEWIRKHSNTTSKKMTLQAFGTRLARGGASGLWEGLKTAFETIKQ